MPFVRCHGLGRRSRGRILPWHPVVLRSARTFQSHRGFSGSDGVEDGAGAESDADAETSGRPRRRG